MMNKIIKDKIDNEFKVIENKINDIQSKVSKVSSSYTLVIHRTDIKNLPNIILEGLKVRKSVTPSGAKEITEISKEIKKQLGIDKDRHKAIYGSFKDKEITISDINELEARQETIIEFKVSNDDNNVFVADFESINRAIFNQIDFNRTKDNRYLNEMKINLYDYWKSFILIGEYIDKDVRYEYLEILIFHDIEPNEIKILYK